MDFVQPPWCVMLLTPAFLLLQIAWYVGVTVLLVRAWAQGPSPARLISATR